MMKSFPNILNMCTLVLAGLRCDTIIASGEEGKEKRIGSK